MCLFLIQIAWCKIRTFYFKDILFFLFVSVMLFSIIAFVPPFWNYYFYLFPIHYNFHYTVFLLCFELGWHLVSQASHA